MLVYILNYAVMFFWSFFNNRKLQVFAIGFQFFLILALRSKTLGVDWYNYIAEFEHYAQYSFVEIVNSFRFFANSTIQLGHESGYVLFDWVLAYLGLPYRAMLVITAFFAVLSLSLTIYRYSKIPWLSFAIVVAIGMYGYMFCILRQSVAVAVLYLAIPYICNRKIVKFSVLVLVASLFHFSSLFFYPIYFLSNCRVNYKNFSIGVLGCLLIILFTPVIFSSIIQPIFGTLGKGYVLETAFTFNFMFEFMLVVIAFIFFSGPQNIDCDYSRELFWGAFMSLPLQALSFYIPIFSRAAIGIFFPLTALLIPNVIASYKDAYKIRFLSLMFYALFFVYYVSFLGSAGLNLVPYKFYFE